MSEAAKPAASTSAALPLSLSYDHRVMNGADTARSRLAFADALAKPETRVAGG